MMLRTLFLMSGLALLTIPLSGCGGGPSGPVGSLSGTVTYQGNPVEEGIVQLNSPTANYAAQAELGSGGAYRVVTDKGGLPPGKYTVTVLPPTIRFPDTPESPGGEGFKEVDNIPQKYRNPTTSGLTITIQEGSNTLDIAMEE